MDTSPHGVGGGAALTMGLALAAGVVAQSLARHLRLPGIVLLLAAGVLLGPDGLGIIEPSTLGDGLPSVVGFAVAIILFEGGLNLKGSRLRRQGMVVRRLITLGGAVTLVGGALVARLVMGWEWRPAILFGSLVVVTGPTVITPLLRRVRVRRRLQTVLEAEGVLIDAIGAVVAVVALEIALDPTLTGTTAGFTGLATRFGIGIGLGAVAGLLIGGALKVPHLVPEGLENITVLSLVVALYQVADGMAAESGIVAVTAAGLVVGNMEVRVLRELMEFKEQLTVLLIGLLFVLLAADVRLAQVLELGWPAVIAVALLIFVVRPVNVAVCTVGSDLSFRERAFLSWIAPRGIVAAAVASLFASELARRGVSGGEELRALVFLVIAVTVTLQGVTMAPVASMLGVRRARDAGWVILGGGGLGLAIGTALRRAGDEAVIVESNVDRVRIAEEKGFRVVFGNGLEETVQQRSQPEIRAGGVGVTPNEEANLMFSRRLREEFACPAGFVALDRVSGHLTAEMVEAEDCRVLFGERRDLSVWSLWLDRGRATVEAWRLEGDVDDAAADDERRPFLPLVLRRGRHVAPVGEGEFQLEDEVLFAVDSKHREEAEERLRRRGWVQALDVMPESAAEPAPPDREFAVPPSRRGDGEASAES